MRVLIKPLLALMLLSAAWAAHAQKFNPAARELSRQCLSGDCVNGYGSLEITTNIGVNTYRGNFTEGSYHGFGKLAEMISRNERAYYEGNWVEGVRSGRGTFWDGRGSLYIGEWKNDRRDGRGSYFFGVHDWTENKYTEFWLSENTENYTGFFKNDLYDGQGTYRWPDGQKYVGGFFANDKHGPGTFYYPRGTIRHQVWEYGDLVD